MLTVVIKDDGEAKVTQLTYQNLWRELKDMPDAEIIVTKNWFSVLPKIKNIYVCFVEADCLVSSGYFQSQIGLFKKNPLFRKLAMLSSAVGVKYWGLKFYGYTVQKTWVGDDGTTIDVPFVEPIKQKRSRYIYPVQIGYVPGAIIRTAMLRSLLEKIPYLSSDLIQLSTQISLGFWAEGDGNRVHINPNTTYVTTEEYVGDLGEFDPEADNMVKMFQRESI